MRDRTIAFSTFLKLLELPEPKKLSALRGFLSGDGYNYWRPSQQLIPEIMAGKISIDSIQERVGQMAKGHQRKYNEYSLTVLLKWASRRVIQTRTLTGRVVVPLGKYGLKVKLEPEAVFEMNGRIYVMHFWATNTPVLSEETLSIGLHFFRKHYKKTAHPDANFIIFDAVKDRLFQEIGILGNAETASQHQILLLDTLWGDVISSVEPGKLVQIDKTDSTSMPVINLQ